MATYSAKDPQWVKPGCSWAGRPAGCPAWHSEQLPQPQMNGTVTLSPTCPALHILAHGLDHAGQFVAGDMGQLDVAVVAHPAVPVAAAQAGRLDLENDPWGRASDRARVTSLGASWNFSNNTAFISHLLAG